MGCCVGERCGDVGGGHPEGGSGLIGDGIADVDPILRTIDLLQIDLYPILSWFAWIARDVFHAHHGLRQN